MHKQARFYAGHEDNDKDIDIQYNSDDRLPSSPEETLNCARDHVKVIHIVNYI